MNLFLLYLCNACTKIKIFKSSFKKESTYVCMSKSKCRIVYKFNVQCLEFALKYKPTPELHTKTKYEIIFRFNCEY